VASNCSLSSRLSLRKMTACSIWSPTACSLGNLVLEGILQSRRAEFVLAEEVELAVMLKSEEIWQAAGANTLGPGRGQQRAIDVGEVRGLVAEHGTGQDVPLATVRPGAVEVGHLGQDAGRRTGEQPGQGGDRLGSEMRGRAAEATVVDQERHSQAEQGLDGEEYGLPAGGDGVPEFELAELLACLADRQIQIVSKIGHTARLLLDLGPSAFSAPPAFHPAGIPYQ
jgi:hypothetical protein